MSNEKRGRGRPPGTGKNDARTLEAVADMVIATPTLRPTTAMRRVARKATEADIRRFQAKWKEERETLLERARVRAEARRNTSASPPRRHRSSSGIASLERISQEMGAVSRLTHEMLDSPAMRAMRDLENSPALKAMRDLENSPALKAMRDLENSPALKAIRDLENSATMRALRDLDSPAMKAIRQYQEMMSRLNRGY